MRPEYIVVQAGGRGSRLGRLTANKPKALVPVENAPILFHLFRRFPDMTFVIIADYRADVLRRYLAAFAPVRYQVAEVHGAAGTCAGLSQALEAVPAHTPFMLIWSDLVLGGGFSFPDGPAADYVGLSGGFTCRWRYQDGVFEEIPSAETGVAGLFLFKDKERLRDVPPEGEFVQWLGEKNWPFRTIMLEGTREYGLLSGVECEAEPAFRCRPFNRIVAGPDGTTLLKEGIDAQGRALAVREKAWYRFATERGFQAVPRIYSYEPFVMQRIRGRNVFDCTLDDAQKQEVLRRIIERLRQLHSLGGAPADSASVYEAYVGKTWQRLDKIRQLVPFADEKSIVINGKRCRNVFFHRAEVESLFAAQRCERFVLLHGDSTFSNILLDERMEPVFIDPRGYFGRTELFGDAAYDWAKLYYSIVGSYDQFNQKRFTLDIGRDGVELSIRSNGWEGLEESFFRLLAGEVTPERIRLLHAMIWLSLTTYAWEDYDSICGAFYNGLIYLEDVLPREHGQGAPL